jgi:hypothetical protein
LQQCEARSLGWNTVLLQFGEESLLAHTFATIILDHIIVTMILDTTVAFGTIDTFIIVALLMSLHMMWNTFGFQDTSNSTPF